MNLILLINMNKSDGLWKFYNLENIKKFNTNDAAFSSSVVSMTAHHLSIKRG